MKEKLSPSMEDYLEAVCELCRENGVARVKDIAARVGYTNASAAAAVKKLADMKLVKHEKYGYVRMTATGNKLASRLLRKHQVLKHFLENVLGLDAETAKRDACRIEHTVSQETLERLRAVADFIESSTHEDLEWQKEFRKFYRRQKG